MFLKDSGSIPLKPGEKVQSIHRVDKTLTLSGISNVTLSGTVEGTGALVMDGTGHPGRGQLLQRRHDDGGGDA